MRRGRTPTVDRIARRIQHCGILNPTEEDLVEYLLTFPYLRRTKRNQLVSMVRRAREKNSKKMKEKEKIDDVNVDVEEELAATPESSGLSTSEDGVYEDKLEPKVDLMKEALRNKYVRLAEANGAEKQMEVEVDGKRGKGAFGGGKQAVGKLKAGDEFEPRKNQGRRFSDMGGMSKLLKELLAEVVEPLRNLQAVRCVGVRPPAGLLLHGPSGCGKTMLAEAIANETGLPFYKISATEIVSGVSGASEENIRELFSKAIRTAPSIVFIDEIDAIGVKREAANRDMGRRIVTQLFACMDASQQTLQEASLDSMAETSDQAFCHVLVIGATNHPDELDPALRRRFNKEKYLGVPDESGRVHILSVLTRGLKLEGSLDLLKIARLTPGYVGSDLASLADEAGILAVQRVLDNIKPVENSNHFESRKLLWSPDELRKLTITIDDFEEAVKKIQPSSKREGFSTIPEVKWEDVGGLDDLRKEFTKHIVKPILFPEKYEKFRVNFDTGFLLHGPPGCGKTLLAKAVANEAGANFIHIKGPEVLNKYVGESEMAVRTIFSRARTCAPCIIFFDEVDALTTKLGGGSGRVLESVARQLMIELDGGDKRSGVYVIGATNRPEAMDPVFKRPGRFGNHLYVGKPSPDQRSQILKALCREKPIDPDVNLDALARNASCENFSGADLSALVHNASIAALEESDTLEHAGNVGAASATTICMRHFEEALATKNARDLKERSRKRLRKEAITRKKRKLLVGLSGCVAE